MGICIYIFEKQCILWFQIRSSEVKLPGFKSFLCLGQVTSLSDPVFHLYDRLRTVPSSESHSVELGVIMSPLCGGGNGAGSVGVPAIGTLGVVPCTT